MHCGSTLAPALQQADRVALFGGSFDPPHAGHLAMARGALHARHLDHVVWVPAARPPHKPGRVLASGEARMEMLQCLLGDEPGHSIWSLELEREGQSFSVDTLRTLRAGLPKSCALYLILGSDNLPGFPSWREMPEILELADPIVLPRTGFPLDPSLLSGLDAEHLSRLFAGFVDLEPVDVCSTDIRAALLNARERPALLPRELWEYLTQRGLYSL